jgi:hypothetical protein
MDLRIHAKPVVRSWLQMTSGTVLIAMFLVFMLLLAAMLLAR